MPAQAYEDIDVVWCRQVWDGLRGIETNPHKRRRSAAKNGQLDEEVNMPEDVATSSGMPSNRMLTMQAINAGGQVLATCRVNASAADGPLQVRLRQETASSAPAIGPRWRYRTMLRCPPTSWCCRASTSTSTSYGGPGCWTTATSAAGLVGPQRLQSYKNRQMGESKPTSVSAVSDNDEGDDGGDAEYAASETGL